MAHKEDSINVVAHHTHYGHKLELQHLTTSQQQKEDIAAKLHLGIVVL
jgi:hypothetical protein